MSRNIKSLDKAIEMLNNLPVPTKKRYFHLPDGSTITNDPTFYKRFIKNRQKQTNG